MEKFPRIWWNLQGILVKIQVSREKPALQLLYPLQIQCDPSSDRIQVSMVTHWHLIAWTTSCHVLSVCVASYKYACNSEWNIVWLSLLDTFQHFGMKHKSSSDDTGWADASETCWEPLVASIVTVCITQSIVCCGTVGCKVDSIVAA